MGRDKRGAAVRSDSGGPGAGAGAGAITADPAGLSYASQQCGLCKQAVDTEVDEHIAGFCTSCKKVPLHMPCVIDYLERNLKIEARKEGGHTSKGLKAVLLLASSRPQELIATNGRMPKWTSLRRCCMCQDGEMLTADVQKARKAAPASRPAPAAPAPAPAKLAAKAAPKRQPAAAPRQQAGAPLGLSTRQPLMTLTPTPADRLRGSGGTNTFAAEQERRAREAEEQERQQRRAAKEAKAAARAQSQASQQSTEQSAAGAAASLPQLDASSLGLPAPLPLPLSHQPSTTSSLGTEEALSYAFEPGGDVPSWRSSSPATWGSNHSDAHSWTDASGYGAPTAAAYDAAGFEAPAGTAAAAAAVAPDVVWLPPQFEGREEAPEEEIDELMAMLGLC